MTRSMGPLPPPRPPVAGGAVTPRIRSGSFTDRVMAQVAEQPRPTPIRVLVRSLVRLDLLGAAAAMRTAIRLAFVPSAGASGALRSRSLALVLAFAFIVGLSAPLAGTGLMGLLRPDGAPTQPLVGAPSPTPSLLSLTPAPLPSSSPTPSPTLKAPATSTPSTTPRPTAKKKTGTDDTQRTSKRSPKPRTEKEREDRDERDEPDEPDEKDEKDEPEDD